MNQNVPAIFRSRFEAEESDAWPQLVYSGDYFSDYLGREAAGTWTLCYGDRDSSDGCEVYETGVRGLAREAEAVAQAADYLNAAVRTGARTVVRG